MNYIKLYSESAGEDFIIFNDMDMCGEATFGMVAEVAKSAFDEWIGCGVDLSEEERNVFDCCTCTEWVQYRLEQKGFNPQDFSWYHNNDVYR